MALAGILCLAKINASATPIRPDIQKVVSESQNPAAEFPPARAGWNGPEAASNTQNPNPTLEKIGPQASARAVRQSLFAVAIPDLRFLALIALVILLLRRIRKHTSRQPAAASAASSNSPVVMTAPAGGDDLSRSDDAEESRPAA
jgi:hypothetical protein